MSRLVRLLASLVLKNDRKEYYLFLCDAHTLSQMERYGWQVNHRGYVYKDQIAQFRKLVDGGKREYHIRV